MRMRNWIAAGGIACVFWAGPGSAQDWVSPETCAVTADAVARAKLPPAIAQEITDAAALVPNGRGRLWKITTPGGKVSHLWGTYHTPDPLLLALPDPFVDLLHSARVVALEFDPIPETRAQATANANTRWMWRDEGYQDWAYIPPEVRDWIGLRMEAIGWGSGYMDQLTLAGLASLMLGDPCGDFLSGVLPGQDGYIGQVAYLAGAEVTGLQQWRDFGVQLNAPERADVARAVIVLYASYLGPPEAYGDLAGDAADGLSGRALSYRLYLEGRMAELERWSAHLVTTLHGEGEGGRLLAQNKGYLVVERNVIFVQAAMPLIEGGDAVIAVGAGHLAGRTGLVAMFRAEGLVVERVVLPGEAP
jgi:uncharacterized protein YbaP (TraB family)